MIARVRPRYLSGNFFESLETHPVPPGDELFFNLGRSALKFFLCAYSLYLNRQPLVAMQSFNCYVVAEAASQADCRVLLLDINTHDFSTTLEEIKDLDDKPDVLLLTHYQGIPNQQYLKISQRCRENNILLIDDISQTEHSYIGDVLVGTRSDISLRSFAFDKPFTSFKGGSLDISNLKDLSLKRVLLYEYARLKYETNRKVNNELRMLKFLHDYTSEESYCGPLGNYKILGTMVNFNLKSKNLSALLHNMPSGFLYILMEKLPFCRETRKDNISITKLCTKKINLILRQRNNYSYNNSEVSSLEHFLSDNGIEVKRFDNCKINWNRYSILDENRRAERLLKSFDIECGNYNWPVPLHILYANNENVVAKKNYTISEYVSNYILNIPIWGNFFRRIDNNVNKQTEV